MILQLQHASVLFVAQLHAVLADPFGRAGLAVVKICYFLLLPLPSETIGVYLQRNALDLHALACQNAYLFVQRTDLPVDGQLVRNFLFNADVHL